jgi:hypothetical protein
MPEKGYYIDEDTTDDFMDLPVPRYAEPTKADLRDGEKELEPLPTPALPPLTDH